MVPLRALRGRSAPPAAVARRVSRAPHGKGAGDSRRPPPAPRASGHQGRAAGPSLAGHGRRRKHAHPPHLHAAEGVGRTSRRSTTTSSRSPATAISSSPTSPSSTSARRRSVTASVPLSRITPRRSAAPDSGIPAAGGHESPRPGWTFGRRRLVFALAVSGAAAGLAVVLSRPARREQDAPAHRVLRQITFDTGLQREPAWSPDGQSVAYASERSGNSDIWIQALADPNPTRITSADAEDSQPDWSPDGRWLVFRSERDGGGLYVVPASGGGERRIASFGYRPKWSPDGSLVLFSSSGHEGGTPKMYVVGLDGGPPQSVRADLVAGLSALQAHWKPDDGRLSIWGRRGKGAWAFLTAPVAGGPVVTSVISREVEERIAAAGCDAGAVLLVSIGAAPVLRRQFPAGAESVARDGESRDAGVDRRPRTDDNGHVRRHGYGRVGRRRSSRFHRATREDPAVVVSLRRHEGTASPAPGTPSRPAAREKRMPTRRTMAASWCIGRFVADDRNFGSDRPSTATSACSSPAPVGCAPGRAGLATDCGSHTRGAVQMPAARARNRLSRCWLPAKRVSAC